MTADVRAVLDFDSLLSNFAQGDRQAFGEVFAHLYSDIHDIAVRELRGERQITIQPTALVHEAYLRMESMGPIQWQGRAHLLAVASNVTRHALIDGARRRRASKRDGGSQVTLSDENLGGLEAGHDALDVDELLTELESINAVAAQVVSLRVFGGMSIDEVAQYLTLSVATVNRRWATGKAWLLHELGKG
jgi:RNA polymerase sigma-70 factor (ECF subfamily)